MWILIKAHYSDPRFDIILGSADREELVSTAIRIFDLEDWQIDDFREGWYTELEHGKILRIIEVPKEVPDKYKTKG